MKKRKTFLPFCLPKIGREEIKEVVDTLKSGWLTTGPKTHKFEEVFRKYIGSNYAVAVNSCTAALNLSLTSINIGPGDEVITTPFTFAATGNMIAMLGAKPVFADIESEHFNIDSTKIESLINKRTKAIIAVHYAGHPCDMKAINSLAKRYGLKVIEDAAHSVGSKYDGKMIGSGENLTCFSFYPIKNMTTGEGGMVTSGSKSLIDRIRILSLHGINKDAWKRYKKEGSWYYQITACGNKYNMTDLQAGIGLAQLKKLETFIKKRKKYAQFYSESFSSIEEIAIPGEPAKNVRHAWHLYPILIKTEKLSINRNRFIEELKNENIGTSVHFIPLHLHPFYQDNYGYKEGDFPIAENIYKNIISLPLYPKMTKMDLLSVVNAVRKVVSKYRR